MTYRDALHLVAQGATPADALAEAGLEDVSPDALSSALRHFAETSPIEVADLLSPFLARTSPVPFEVDDLEPLPEADAILADGGGIADLLTEIGLDASTVDVDAAFDAAEDAAVELIEAAEAAGTAATDAAVSDETFGIGDEMPDDADALDVLEEIGRAGEADAPPPAEEPDDGIDELSGVDRDLFTDTIDQIDHVSEAAGIDELGEDNDPLDFDMG
jgi:hypothetical protein